MKPGGCSANRHNSILNYPCAAPPPRARYGWGRPSPQSAGADVPSVGSTRITVKCEICSTARSLALPFGVYLHRRDHLGHPILDLTDLRMDLFDEVVFDPR